MVDLVSFANEIGSILCSFRAHACSADQVSPEDFEEKYMIVDFAEAHFHRGIDLRRHEFRRGMDFAEAYIFQRHRFRRGIDFPEALISYLT